MIKLSRNEAQKLTLYQLHGLYKEAFNQVAAAPHGSNRYHTAVKSLYEIKCALRV